MSSKVILILVDGMRPDGLEKCSNPYIEELKKITSYTLDAKTVFPPVTLPCHMSLFHSVPPERHGTVTNTYVPQVRPINGLFEQLKSAGKRSAMFYGWEQLRDICRPGTLDASEFIQLCSLERTDGLLTDRAIEYIKKMSPDFVFLYLGETDEKGGHDNGWMSDIYLDYINYAVNDIKKVIEETKDEYTVIVTADHGGHERIHGDDIDEDMTIPMLFYGKQFEGGKQLENVSILDIAPTIAEIMDIPKAREWEGRSLI